MSEKQPIVFIDDEPYLVSRYRDELEKRFDVVFAKSAALGLRAIEATTTAKALVLDIMMPPPQGVDERETEFGLKTGIWLLAKVKQFLLSRNQPVVVLTNRKPKDLETYIKKLGFPNGFIVILAKPETPAFYLPKRVADLVTEWKLQRK